MLHFKQYNGHLRSINIVNKKGDCLSSKAQNVKFYEK